MKTTEEGQIIIKLLQNHKDWAIYGEYCPYNIINYISHVKSGIRLRTTGFLFITPEIKVNGIVSTELFSRRENRIIKRLIERNMNLLVEERKSKQYDPIKMAIKSYADKIKDCSSC